MRRLGWASLATVACGERARGGIDPGSGGDSGDSGAPAGVEWVELVTGGGLAVDALFAHPGDGLLPAAVYHHGKVVSDLGYEEAAAQGYDVADFPAALAEAGFAGLAPIRPGLDAIDDWDDYVDIALAAVEWLASRDDIDSSRVFTTGYSQGGLIALQAAVADDSGMAGLVVMSPAPGEEPNDWASTAIRPNLEGVSGPILVTLGEEEPNPDIVHNVDVFMDLCSDEGIEATLLTYPGADHEWFQEPRDDWWPDVTGWLGGG